MTQYLLAIDMGTTSTRAIIFSKEGRTIAQHQLDIKPYFPKEGWVEQNPEEIWKNTLLCSSYVLKESQLEKAILALGITNQRETTLIWDKKTGEAIYPAIVWQDRRTSEYCLAMSDHSIQKNLHYKTGLLLDPYFSASKIVWILNHVPDARLRSEKGELLFGTIDTFLLWRLTKGKIHATDATNASRTLLFNIRTQEWDRDILNAFNIPEKLLPKVRNSSDDFGHVDAEFLGSSIPITSMIGDQQAATVGQACFSEGMIKSTLGTGAFVLMNTGSKIIQSKNKLISTIAYRINEKVTYGLEGSIFNAGATIKWLRDNLQLIQTAAETEQIAENISDNGGVYLVPAFTGLGAPHWKPDARGAILGLTRDSSKAQIVRAALEAVAYQIKDLLKAMLEDSGMPIKTLRVDGGMAANNWLLQFLADILGIVIERPSCIEITARGAAFLAGLQVGVYQSLEEISLLWEADKMNSPKMNHIQRENLYQGWLNFIDKIKSDGSA